MTDGKGRAIGGQGFADFAAAELAALHGRLTAEHHSRLAIVLGQVEDTSDREALSVVDVLPGAVQSPSHSAAVGEAPQVAENAWAIPPPPATPLVRSSEGARLRVPGVKISVESCTEVRRFSGSPPPSPKPSLSPRWESPHAAASQAGTTSSWFTPRQDGPVGHQGPRNDLSNCSGPVAKPPPKAQSIPAGGLADGHKFEVIDGWRTLPENRKGANQSVAYSDVLQMFRNADEVTMWMSRSSCASRPADERSGALAELMRRLIIPPSSRLQIVLEAMGLLCTVFDALVLPFQLFEPPESPELIGTFWAARVYWTLNIFVSCICGYVDAMGIAVMEPRLIAMHYIRTWGTFDVSLVTIDWVTVVLRTRQGVPLRAARLLRLMRLARLFKARAFVTFLSTKIRNQVAVLSGALLEVISSLAFLSHFLASGWYYVGNTALQDGLPSWLDSLEGDLNMQDVHYRYIKSYHCALALFFGEHVAEPQSTRERYFVCVALVLTFMTATVFQAQITTVMTRLTIISGQRLSKLSALYWYLSDNNISTALRMKVSRNAQHALAEQKRNPLESSVELLSIISEPLRRELHFEVLSPVLLNHPFFRCFQDVNRPGFMRICHECVERRQFSRGDIVFVEQEMPDEPMTFFITRGSLLYSQSFPRGKDPVSLSEAYWLSEAAVWTQWAYRGTLHADEESQLLGLDATRFMNVVTSFPFGFVRTYAQEFVSLLNGRGPQEHSDVARESDPDVARLVGIAFPHHMQKVSRNSSSAGARGSFFRGSFVARPRTSSRGSSRGSQYGQLTGSRTLR